ncbi:MAG: hypothetical protein DWH91_03065 [Planctomycetota bacterium]|nr:MAG: hypothetical protein DWH91_03065 [Planctomycetota bacterium]
MSFLHPALIAGLSLAVLPVILHFLMKQKPKRLIFPALRLIQKQQKQNTRRFRLRHFWLLFLRMLALALLALCLARPSLPPANYAFSGWEWGTLGLVVGGGLTAYFSLLHRWKNQGMGRAQLLERRTSARLWTTMGVLALLALTVGWPYQRRVWGEIKDPAPVANLHLPVAAIWLFDTSQSMSYTQEGKTRLDAARTLALNHLGDMPSGSRLAVADSSADNPIIFQSTLSTAQTRVESLEPHSVSLTLNDRLRAALQAQLDDRNRTLTESGASAEEAHRDRFIRRVYIFTDLARSAWGAGVSQALRNDLDKLKEVDVYLIDVGELQAQNVAVTQVGISRQRISRGGSLDVQATISSVGVSEEVTVKLQLADARGQLISRGDLRVKLDGSPVQVEFPRLKGLTGPVVHGLVQVDRGDPLMIDNTRYFTTIAGPPTRVLIVTPESLRASQIRFALAPFLEGDGEVNVFAPEIITPHRLTEDLIRQSEIIWLQDLPQLSDLLWTALAKHVEQGHGLIVTLGDDRIDPVAYNRTAAQVCLPASLDVWKPKSVFHLLFPNRVHPLFGEYREQDQNWAVLESDIRIARFWKVVPAGGATVIVNYDDKDRSPAVLERPFGKGRVLMFTSGTHLPDNPSQRWNNFPTPLVGSWMWIAFVQQLADYGSGGGVELFNHQAGEEVTITLPASPAERQVWLQEPGLLKSPRTIPPDGTTLTATRTDAVGHYTVQEGIDQLRPVTGFSANLPPAESDLTRSTPEQLNEMLGADRYQLARSIDELKANIRSSDLGQEVFPILLVVLMVVFGGEHLVANRFYEET